MRGTPAPAWHSCEADTVLDDIEQLSIGHALCFRLPHVRSPRIQALAHFDVSAAVVGMARRAVVSPVGAGISKRGGGIRHGIQPFPHIRRQGEAAGAAGYPALNRTWLFPRAQAVRVRKKNPRAKKSSGDGC